MKSINLLIIILSLVLSACGSNSYISKAPKSNMKIDGNLNDWKGDLKYIEDEKAAIGVKNDKDNLYICFTTSDRTKITQIFLMGFTVWLKPVNAKTLGIQYPLRSEKSSGFNGKNKIRNGQSSSKLINNYLKKNSEFLIMNEDHFPLYGSKIGMNSGYKIGLGYQKGKFVYEIRIPFIHYLDKYIPIVDIPEKKLDVVFQSGEIDINLINNNRIPSGNAPIGRGRDGIGRGGNPGRSPFNGIRAPDQIDISLSVQLN